MVLWVAEGSLCFLWYWLEHHDGWNVQNGLTYTARSSELLAVCLGSLCVALWASLQHGGWVPGRNRPRNKGEATKTFHDLTLEVTQHHLPLFIHKACPDPRGVETDSIS